MPRHRGASGAVADVVLCACASLIAVLLPLSLMALAAAAVFRIPDLMAFEIDRSGTLPALGLDTQASAVSKEIADFLTHKIDTLTLATEIAHKDVPVFTFMDEVNLDKTRDLLDKALYPSAGAFALSVLLFAVCRIAERRRFLKHAMGASAVVYICAACFAFALALSVPFRGTVLEWQPGLAHMDGDVLPQLLGGLYPALAAGAVCLISFIAYIVLYSLSRRFTQEKETMFR